LLAAMLQNSDAIVCFGGEEFLAGHLNCDYETAREMANRIRVSIPEELRG